MVVVETGDRGRTTRWSNTMMVIFFIKRVVVSTLDGSCATIEVSVSSSSVLSWPPKMRALTNGSSNTRLATATTETRLVFYTHRQSYGSVEHKRQSPYLTNRAPAAAQETQQGHITNFVFTENCCTLIENESKGCLGS